MSVHDETEFPFLTPEKALIRQFVKEKKPVSGICLGAQLIASAHGAPVTKYLAETGWCPIKTVHNAFPALPRVFHAFQLHQDTFGIPPEELFSVPESGYKTRLFCTEVPWGSGFMSSSPGS